MCGSADSSAGPLVQRGRDGACPTKPAGADPDRAVPETRPVEILARRADGHCGRAVELDGAGVRLGHPGVTPIAGQRVHIRITQVDGEQPTRPRPGPYRVAPSPAHACRCPHPNTTPWCRRASPRHLHRGPQHRVARFGGPNPPELIGFGIGAPQLGEDRDGVGVRLGQPACDDVGLGQFGQPMPSQRGLARSGSGRSSSPAASQRPTRPPITPPTGRPLEHRARQLPQVVGEPARRTAMAPVRGRHRQLGVAVNAQIRPPRTGRRARRPHRFPGRGNRPPASIRPPESPCWHRECDCGPVLLTDSARR